ncbi:hypothetical protein FWK35_00036713 [Aphis craccivora]|uniref:Uncharacterized protein n=1 Tax=Aphis craccivora TaxID=307492 RepID=A0A6G0VLX0_APHCR|nr:hypothetical protein FWK35_00036713 [Aphis craccivora]
MKLVGALGGYFLNIPIVFKSAREKPKKN